MMKINSDEDKKRQIRWNMFETNSSSVHTVVYSKHGMEKSRFKLDDEGKIHISLDTYFGKDYCIYDTQEEKLKYILSYIYDNNYDRTYQYDIDRHEYDYPYELRNVEAALIDYIDGCTGIVFDSLVIKDEDWEYYYDSHFDHQSSPSESMCPVDYYDKNAVLNFIFNKDIYLKTDCD